MKTKLTYLLTSIVLATSATSLQAASFGNMEDTDYGKKLWQTMEQSRLVGAKATISVPYKGIFPHGDFLDTIDANHQVGQHDGRLIIKRNYGGKGVTKEMVANNPEMYMKAVTVMYQREKGYDAENQDWFYVKYDTKGSILQNPKKVALAGRIGKGTGVGCIACHKAAPGGDMVYINNRK